MTIGGVTDLRAEEDKMFARIWIIAAIVATVSTPFVVLWKESLPWLITIPISIGVVIVFASEFRRQLQMREDSETSLVTISALPPDYKGIGAYEESVALEIKPLRRGAKGQLDMFEAMNAEDFPQTKVRVFRNALGKEVYVVNCNRFVELMVSKLVDDVDKAAEHALAMAWKRYRQDTKDREELRKFLDKTVRETIKSDFRGNALIIFSKTGEKVMKELVASAEEAISTETTDPQMHSLPH